MIVNILRTREEFLELEHDWRELYEQAGRPDFYLSYDWFYAMICLAQKPPARQYILTVRDGGTLAGILPCCISNKRVRLFNHRALELIGNIYSPYRSGLVLPEKEDAVAHALSWFLHDNCCGDWEIINFECVSPRDNFLNRLDSLISKWDAPAKRTLLFVNMISDFKTFARSEDFFSTFSSNTRNHIRKNFNRLKRLGAIDIVMTSHEQQDIGRAMADYYEVYRASWKHAEMFDPQFHLRLAKYLAAKDKLRIFAMYLDRDETGKEAIASAKSSLSVNDGTHSGIPIASSLFIVTDGKAYFLKTAYRREFADYSAGTILLWFVMRHLIDVDKVKLIDHQKGDEPYKYKWAKVNDERFLYQAANPRSVKARLDLWLDNNIVPPLKKALVFLGILKNKKYEFYQEKYAEA